MHWEELGGWHDEGLDETSRGESATVTLLGLLAEIVTCIAGKGA